MDLNFEGSLISLLVEYSVLHKGQAFFPFLLIWIIYMNLLGAQFKTFFAKAMHTIFQAYRFFIWKKAYTAFKYFVNCSEYLI